MNCQTMQPRFGGAAGAINDDEARLFDAPLQRRQNQRGLPPGGLDIPAVSDSSASGYGSDYYTSSDDDNQQVHGRGAQVVVPGAVAVAVAAIAPVAPITIRAGTVVGASVVGENNQQTRRSGRRRGA